MNNNLINESKRITNLSELESISNQIETIQNEIRSITNDSMIDSYEKKLKISELVRKETKLKEILLIGIPIDCSDLKAEIEKNIIDYLESYGLNTNIIKEKLKNIKFYITNERLSSGGLLSAYSNKISIDYSLTEFDDMGNFIGLKQDKYEFIKYVMTHELLHICSFKGNETVKDDALSEGFTDLFAQVISNNFKDKSIRYDFLVRVCILLTNCVGIKKALEDYLNNLGDFPSLKNLFKFFGLNNEQFIEFYQKMNNINQTKMIDGNEEEIYNQKLEIIEFLKYNIFIPYIKEQEDKESYINLFNQLFGDFGIYCSLEEVKSNVI